MYGFTRANFRFSGLRMTVHGWPFWSFALLGARR